MKNRVKILFLLIVSLLVFSSCNRQVIDTKYKFDYVIMRLPNDEIVEGKIMSWKDYDDGEQIQVKLDNGKTYLTTAVNCTLIAND